MPWEKFPGHFFISGPAKRAPVRQKGTGMNDCEYMKLALELAARGTGHVAPNPLVGALIVKNDRIIGEGWHAKYGEAHAERNALASLNESADGATMYVTLEPCCHTGKQPPCTDAILSCGIRRVVIGCTDPNPLVAGRGIRILQEHGIEVTTDVCHDECVAMNQVFFHYIRTGLPYVIMKYGMSTDGKTASYTGASKWITGETARAQVHALRGRYTAIMTGVGTILSDDPQLTCRIPGGYPDPVRIICDYSLRTPLTSNVVRQAQHTRTIIATCAEDASLIGAYTSAGCEIWQLPGKDGHVDLQALCRLAGSNQIDSILLEGGSSLNWSALESGIVNKVMAYIAPLLMGGTMAMTPVEGTGFPDPDSGLRLKNCRVTPIGEDFLMEGEIASDVYRNH